MGHKIQSHQLYQLPKIPKSTVKNNKEINSNFSTLLAAEINPQLKVSKHAQKRLDERGIEIGEKKWNIIEAKMKEAKEKGISDSLVIMDDAALVVSVKNNTVITALDRMEASSQIFTNINGTIIIN
ncbi:TIGR02530 family flagellar biosynthesis protein [Bacillus alkalicellulosilyticus]|uniref:TIGR02530 family flagellar biosynthesis protein n=1 Tax=Alkalihalobacterium alkalicellulosilyticum TaxID=1912214 RepID=UPI000996BCC6|nr:TIGR02530 family flagellar biosynthesis protein [Bacillus alkalicellulosilyticus]